MSETLALDNSPASSFFLVQFRCWISMLLPDGKAWKITRSPCGAIVLTTSALKQGEESRSPLVSPLLLFVGVRFQVSFTPLAGVLFTFPSRY